MVRPVKSLRTTDLMDILAKYYLKLMSKFTNRKDNIHSDSPVGISEVVLNTDKLRRNNIV